MVVIIALISGLTVSLIMHKRGVFANKEKHSLYEGVAGVVTAAVVFLLFTLFTGTSSDKVDNKQLAVNDDVKVTQKEDKQNIEKEEKKDDKEKEEKKEDKEKEEKKDVTEEKNKQVTSKTKSGNKKSESTSKNISNSNVKKTRSKKQTASKSVQSKPSASKPEASKKVAQSTPSAPKPAPSKERAPKTASKTQAKPVPTKPKVEYRTEKEKIELPYETRYKDNYDLMKGNDRVKQEGKNGYEVYEKKYKIENGKKTLVSSMYLETVEPVDKIVEIGMGLPLEFNYELSKVLFNETNAYRRKNGMPELKWNENLSKAAMVRSKEVVTSYSHTRPDGSPLSSVYKEFNVPVPNVAGENIAGGLDASSVIAAWAESPGHNRNMLSSGYKEIGIGVYGNEYGYYWVQLFVG